MSRYIDYSQVYHDIRQSPPLAERQMMAFQYFAPQDDNGSHSEAMQTAWEWEQEQMYDGSSHEGGHQ